MTQVDIKKVAPEQPTAPDENKNDFLSLGVLAVALIGVTVWKPDLGKTILTFIVTLSILVFVHEWGHFQFGRWAGMKINRFGIGFPPWIFTRYRKGIAYSIGALPIGGMVDIAGLGSEEEMVSDVHGAEVSPDKYTRRKNVPHGQKEFQDASLGWRFMTLFAGPLMNFIFALVVFTMVFSLIGVPIQTDVTRRVDMVSPGTPAFAAGIQSGDVLVGVNGLRSDSSQEIRDLIRASNGQPVKVMIERGSKVLSLPMTPIVEDSINEDTGKRENAAIIGVMFTPVNENVKLGVFRGPTGFWDGAIGTGIYGSWQLTQRIFGLLSRVVTLRMTADDKRQVGGPVKIAQAVDHVRQKSLQDILLMAASLSVNLGLMNLLPIPALDGGRIMFLGYELIARRPADPKRETLVNAVGMGLVLSFMLFMTLRDVLPFLSRSFQ